MSEILKRPDVIAAYKGLVNKSPGYCSHQREAFCDQCGIPGSVADVAFQMRDACDRLAYVKGLQTVYYDVSGEPDLKGMFIWCELDCTAEHMIEAATLAFKGAKP